MNEQVFDSQVSESFSCDKQTIHFLQSQNELLQDQVTSLQSLLIEKSSANQKIQDKLNDTLLLVRERDTELRILTKEKESISDKLMEQKLEVLKMRSDGGGHSTFRDLRR